MRIRRCGSIWKRASSASKRRTCRGACGSTTNAEPVPPLFQGDPDATAPVYSRSGLVVPAAGPLPVRAEEPPAQLLARLLAPTPIVADLAELTDTIGGRPTGSPALDRAVEWGLGRFREAGLENVHAEEYVAPRLWLPGPESAEVTQPRAPWQPAERAALHVAALAYSSPTPAAGLEAEVADVGSGEEAGFAAAGGRVRGRLLLLHTEPMRSIDDLFKEYLETPGIESREIR